MIDIVTIKTDYTNQEFEALTARLSLNAPIDSEKVKVNWSNMRFVYYPNTNTLTLSNSLHKFYNLELNDIIRAPVNHNNYTYSNFYSTVAYLSEGVFEKSPSELKISSRFEFGLNINTDNYKPFDLICKYQACVITHSNEFFTAPPYRGKPIQRNCHFSDWYIKGYDKGKQAGLINTNLLRYEIVVTELRKLRNILAIQEVSIGDICNPDAWNKLFNYLISTYDSIRKIPQINNCVISNDDTNSIYGYCNKLMRGDLKQYNSKYFFELLNKKNSNIYSNYNLSDLNYHNVIKQKMHSNYAELMKNHQANFSTCNAV